MGFYTGIALRLLLNCLYGIHVCLACQKVPEILTAVHVNSQKVKHGPGDADRLPELEAGRQGCLE